MCRSNSVEQWRRANPYVLVNAGSVGTACGRYATLQEAQRAVALRGAEYVGVSGTHVYFRESIYV